ncbi:unnamed protein product [Caenorhabditis angaria]|uniref:Protein-S-isoprenylcysteine O-methyltransferase n=1 Tax=Caenorhabditis angaria TaxID=860376 RepID=A0A9P1MSQ0_9PELO|nr:unnamed protein product [Caenorhabditis angaria]
MSAIFKQFQLDTELRHVSLHFLLFFIVTVISSLAVNFWIGLIFVLISGPISWKVGKFQNWKYQCTTQAAVLGATSGFSLIYSIINFNDKSSFIVRYFFLLSIFHFTEYIFTALSNRRSLQADSFLLNHSVSYWIAAIASWIEFGVEVFLIPEMKLQSISLLGVGLCIFGDIFRKTAMLTAGSGFTHRLAQTKRYDHKLMTEGIYSYVRHPAYCGWFIWAVSTQIVMCNPICCIAYGYVTWHFFSQRIYDEERDLFAFFGEAYLEYKQNVPSGVPFVSGYDRP